MAIWIEDYLKKFDPDPLRYYLTAIAPESRRTTFDIDDFITRNNTELLNSLGNFINRTVTFTHKYFEGVVPRAGERDEPDLKHLKTLKDHTDKVAGHLGRFEFKAGLGEIMALSRTANAYFDSKEPWKQRKENLAACGTTINVCLQTVKTLAVIMAPYLPFSSAICAGMLNLDGNHQCILWDEAVTELKEGHRLGEPIILFKKLDAAELFDKSDNPGNGRQPHKSR